MLFFLFNSYNFLLIAAAVVPAILLLIRVYRSDRLEKEPTSVILLLILSGVFATLFAMVGEWVGSYLLTRFSDDEQLYDVLLYFLVVAGCEEGFKYYFLKRRTWFADCFNCQFDGIVYAVAVSLGFALWENISYVTQYGFGTALVRAVTAVPGHCCFGVFMGAFYGMAKRYDNYGYPDKSEIMRWCSVLVPMALHGAYDYIATRNDGSDTWYFLAFIAVLFLVAFRLVKRLSERDRYIV